MTKNYIDIPCPVCGQLVYGFSPGDKYNSHVLGTHINDYCLKRWLGGDCPTCEAHFSQYSQVGLHFMTTPCGEPWEELLVMLRLAEIAGLG